MKHTKSIGLAALLAATLIVMAGCAKADPGRAEQSDTPIAGGYSEDRALSAEDTAVFKEATASLDGASYEPTLVATQVVAGTNYRFTATAAAISPEAEPETVYVYIFKPLDGAAELTEITPIESGEE